MFLLNFDMFTVIPHSLALAAFFLVLTAFHVSGSFFIGSVQANVFLVGLCACAYLSQTVDKTRVPFLFTLLVYSLSVLFLLPWIFLETVVLLFLVAVWCLLGRFFRTGTPIFDFLLGLVFITLGFYWILAVLEEGGGSFVSLVQETVYTIILGFLVFFFALRYAVRSLHP